MLSASSAPASGDADFPARNSIHPERMLESSMRSADIGWRLPCMMSTHSQTSTQLPEKRPSGSSMVVSRAAVRVPASSPVSTMSVARYFEASYVGMNAPLPTLTSSTRARMSSASFFDMMLAQIRNGDSTVPVWSRMA